MRWINELWLRDGGMDGLMDGWTGGSCTLDINECDTNTNSCNQTCVNTIGSYVCTCLEGYIVTNGTHCIGRFFQGFVD